jgi:hypothetical protein
MNRNFSQRVRQSDWTRIKIRSININQEVCMHTYNSCSNMMCVIEKNLHILNSHVQNKSSIFRLIDVNFTNSGVTLLRFQQIRTKAKL